MPIDAKIARYFHVDPLLVDIAPIILGVLLIVAIVIIVVHRRNGRGEE